MNLSSARILRAFLTNIEFTAVGWVVEHRVRQSKTHSLKV